MSYRDLIFYAFCVFALSFSFFFVGFLQIGGPTNATKDGVALDLLSAIAWGLGSIGGAPPRWSNRSNLFAALFAAASVGFLAPADVCDTSLLSAMCDLGALLAPASPVLLFHIPNFTAMDLDGDFIAQNP